MNENPEGVPVGPVHPAQPLAPEPGPSQPSQSAEPVEPNAEPVAEPNNAPAAESASVAEPVGEPKKKTGLIAGIIALVVLVCAGVAVALLYPFGGDGGGQNDRVPKALANLFEKGAPTNVGMDGTITINNSAPTDGFPLTKLTIDFDGKVNTEKSVSLATATITAFFSDNTKFSFDTDEILAEGGDLYVKISGLSDAVDDYIGTVDEGEILDCTEEDPDCVIDGKDYPIITFLAMLKQFGVVDIVDEEWILISTDGKDTSEELDEMMAPTQCLVDALGTVQDYSDDVAKDYNNSPFITYSTENLAISKKKNELYKLGIDADKMATFVNKMKNYGFVNELFACMDVNATNTTVDADNLTEAIEALPVTYVEIDEDNHFTRVYLDMESLNDTYSGTADINLSYPSSFTIETPSEYIELEEVINKLFGGLYDSMFTY